MPIHKLPEEIVRRIAAGEVVDHPSSVVKELIENGLDAGADKIKISIDGGGKSRIVVEDNGNGMSAEELKVAVLPHTTSKIEKFEDLYRIGTFGFRGEALGSISAVSKMRIETSSSGEIGASLDVIGGAIGEVTKIAKERGTRVIVSDLFFNIPARRKFLSSTSVETRMVTEVVQKFILSKNVGFRYLHDDQEIYNIKPGLSLEERIKVVLGDYELVKMDSVFGGVRIYGYVSAPTVGRQNRVNEIIFVNGRYVRSGLLMKAIEVGYAQHLKKGEFPIAVMFLEVPPQLVDVNVHPQKLEVKFSDQSKIFGMIVGAVKKALASPSVFKIPIEKGPMRTSEPTAGDFNSSQVSQKNLLFSTNFSQLKKSSSKNLNVPFDTDMIPKRPELAEAREKLSKTKFLGVIHGRYITCESENALYLVDMHAAHERILYDKFKTTPFSTSQHLAISIKLDLTETQREILEEHKNEIHDFGFEWKDDELTGVPNLGKAIDWREVFISTVESFRLSFVEDPRNEFLATLACKAAVKTGEKISIEEIDQLLKDLDELEVWSCPHGRPLVYSIDFKRLDRYFGR